MLSADKHYLVESRLLPVARKAGLFNLTGLVAKLKGPDAEPLMVEVVEAMTTNESFFFRDKAPFDNFRDTIMPALLAARGATRRIRIWCAAASTGQEPYSLAICLKEMGKELRGWRVEILATDLSNEVLEKAKSGIYSQFEVQRGLPALMLIKYFSQLGETWQIAPEVRAMVKFMPLNLLHDFSHLGRFDVVFCRNVLIYFDQATKSDVLDRASAGHRARWLPGAGRRGNRAGADRPVQADGRPARALCAVGRRGQRRRAESRAGWPRRDRSALTFPRSSRIRCFAPSRNDGLDVSAKRQGTSTILPIAFRDSISAWARRASASGMRAAIAGLTLPLPSSSTACAIACRRGSSMWS